MSVAQKEWPVRGRILMTRISRTNGDPRETKPLTNSVALVTGGSRGIGPAIPRRLAFLRASRSICGRGPAPLDESATDLAKNRVRVHTPVADVTKQPDAIDPVSRTE